MSRVPPWLKILLTAYFLQREMQTQTSWCLIVKTAEKKGEKKLSWFENNNSEEHYKVKTWSNSIAKNNCEKFCYSDTLKSPALQLKIEHITACSHDIPPEFFKDQIWLMMLFLKRWKLPQEILIYLWLWLRPQPRLP